VAKLHSMINKQNLVEWYNYLSNVPPISTLEFGLRT
jgi:hypothetical protein